MADYFPLIVVAANSSIDELPAGDNLNLSGSNIVNAINITATTNITANTFLGNFSGNFAISGGNTEVVFISNGNTNTSTKFTFNTTGNTLTVDGNAQFNNTNLGNLATANFFTGNGSLLTALTGANVSGQVANALVAGTVYTNAQPNITSVGTLTSLGVSGTITAANITANTGVFTGNGNGLSSLVGANVSGAVAYATTANAVAGANVSGTVANATYATSAGSATTAGTVTTNAQPNITSVGTLTSLAVTGNITAGNLIGPLANGNSNVYIASANGNVTIAAVGNTTMTVTGTGANITGYANVSGNISAGNVNAGNLLTANYSTAVITTAAQPNITSVGTLTSLGVSGTITAANITANTGVFTGNGNGLSSLVGANVTGTVANATYALSAGTAGTVTTAAQGNITSVGTLTSLSVTGNISAGNISATNHTGTTSNLTGQYITTLTTGTAPLVVTSTTRVANLNVDYANVADNINVTAPGTGTAYIVGANASTGNVAEWTSSGMSMNLATNAITATTFIGALSGAATTAGTVTTAAQPNITSVGTLTSLGVSGTITAANITANTGVFTGNGNGLSSLVGANVTGTVANATYALSAGTAGTVTTNAQPNITSVGTLTSLAVTGNITNGNITGGNLVSASFLAGTLTTAAQPNITSTGTLTSLSVTGNVTGGNLVTAGVLSVTGNGVSSIGGNLDMTSNNIINLATPVNSTDAATKQYVDDVAQGLNIHDSCNAATTGTLATISGGTVTYNNGTSGVGATLTTTGSYTTMDGVTLTDGMRILVKNEVAAANNGIYVRTSSTVLTRAADFNTVPEIEAGDFTFVTAGTVYDNTGWVQTSTVVTIGTDPIDWTQFSGAGTYSAGTGLTLTGSVFSINVAQPTITSVGTLTSLSVSGNGSFGNVSATTFTGALAGAATTAGTVTTNAQPNITSVGTLTSLGVSGTITAANITANTGVFTGNGNGLSSLVGANVTGTVASATSATTAGTVTTAAQGNITSVGTLTSLGVNGTVTAVAFTANTGVFTGNGNGLSSLVGANVTGTVPLANVATYDSITTLSVGNAYMQFANTLTGTAVAYANAAFVANTSNGALYATTFVGALSGAATSATTAGTVTTAAQGNITSVGTLTSLGVNGTVTAVAFTANTGVFTGNANGLSSLQGTNVTGTLNSTTLGNSTVYIGTTGIALNRASASQSLTGITSIDGYAATVSGAAQGNITSVGTLTSLSVTGNVSAGNVNAGNLLTANYSTAVITTAAQPNITSVGTLTSLAVTGNATMANVVASTYDITGVATGISAAGTTQAGGTVLAKAINVVSTVLSGNGVVLPVAVAGMRITVVNTSANSLAVYPAASGIINSQAANAAYTQPAGARLDFVSISTTQWYTLNATYG
jgi:hypothetical protein